MYDLMGRVKVSGQMVTRTTVVESQLDKFLEGISGVFNDALTELPTDDQAHLRR
ncbi:hypothetical protein M404DRAFT_994164 [Pisolithus tinctorius Marx 270]|uniref:Uncharacterized protein n=1 Tax=Pisolithus tinctorius Marx 270 TaxID=870435 RepID=A0A0C3JSU1_PISTI|nr:hypothetical protein M404DRAFT_994164 [Pisolithus tinctorius Marx 270]